MNNINGYIYIRNHPSYSIDNACKLGKASNIPERDSQYATGEIKRGYFEAVFEIPIKQMGIIEKLLQYEFNDLNIKYDAGTEFYNNKIINLIEPYLMAMGFKYKKLSKKEISDLVRCNRVKKIIEKINIKSLINVLKSDKKEDKKEDIIYIPRDYQIDIINKSITYFEENDKGMLILICGMGKTLISLWITQNLQFNTILIGVPNKLLLNQWKEIISILFQNIPYLIVFDDITIKNIERFLKTNTDKCIIITTYASSYKVYKATQNLSFIFNIKILDEVHHLTSSNMKIEETTKYYIEILKISSVKQLSLTATIKQLENISNDKTIISNDDIQYFGEIIDRKNLCWAIGKDIVCNYDIQIIITTDKQQLEKILTNFNIVEENDKRLFLSSFASLKSIFENESHHILIYANNKENTLKIVKYIKMLLDNKYFDIPDLYYSNYHSEMNVKTQDEIINNFKNKEKPGIITCVYCLGEGWDLPLLDSVIFAENMSSNIRIVQSALRASRKNKDKLDKKTKIILPILNNNDFLDSNNSDFKKIREVIYQLGLEDKTITQKIKVFNIEVKKQNLRILKEKIGNDFTNNVGEYDDKLTQIIRLKTIERSSFDITYEKARKIIASKNIKNKESYYELCDNDNRLFKEPDIKFKGQFTNWIEYLSIERVYYDLTTCKKKIDEYLLLYPEIKKHYLNLSIVCEELCKLDDKFPPKGLWVEYYNIKSLQDIINIVSKKKKIAVIL
jgi:superfamily II DNA or RNA helicase